MTEEIEKLIAAKEKALGFGDYDNWKNNHICELMKEHAAAEVERFYELLVKHRAKFWPDDNAGEQLAQVRLDNYEIKDAPSLEELLSAIGFYTKE